MTVLTSYSAEKKARSREKREERVRNCLLNQGARKGRYPTNPAASGGKSGVGSLELDWEKVGLS